MEPLTILILVLVSLAVFGLVCAIMIYGENQRSLDRVNQLRRLRARSLLAVSIDVSRHDVDIAEVETESGNRDRRKSDSRHRHKKRGSKKRDKKDAICKPSRSIAPTQEEGNIPKTLDNKTEGDARGDQVLTTSAFKQDISTEYAPQKNIPNKEETRTQTEMFVSVPSDYETGEATSSKSVFVDHDRLPSGEGRTGVEESTSYTPNELPPIRGIPPPPAEYIAEK